MSVTQRTQTGKALAGIRAEIEHHAHGRVPRELRARQVLELAKELFAERGYAAAPMDELARRAGVSKPVIYGLFGSKQGLFAACVEELGRELTEAVLAAVEGESEPEALLRSGSLAFFRFVEERRAAWTMTFNAARSLPDPSEELARTVAGIRRRQDELVSAVIAAQARRLGVEPDPLEVGGMTRALNGLYEGLVDWWTEHPEVGAETLAGWVVDLVLPGLEGMARGGVGERE